LEQCEVDSTLQLAVFADDPVDAEEDAQLVPDLEVPECPEGYAVVSTEETCQQFADTIRDKPISVKYWQWQHKGCIFNEGRIVHFNAYNGTSGSKGPKTYKVICYSRENPNQYSISTEIITPTITPIMPTLDLSPIITPLPNDRRNVLHIIADDMRPNLHHAYGSTDVDTPNLDALSKKSSVFVNAYCQQAICNPSRNSFLTGLRPDSTQVWTHTTSFRKEQRQNAISLHKYFKDHGYLTLGAGKVYHLGNNNAEWSRRFFKPTVQHCPPAPDGLMPLFCVDEDDAVYEDREVAEKALEYLTMAKIENKNFYIAAGFNKPHTPFRMPRSFWNNYESRTIASAKYRLMHPSVPDVACVKTFGVRYPNGTLYSWDPKENAVPVEAQIDVRKHYYASISWVDSLIGLLLKKLDDLGLTDSTMVMFHGDHGYYLGESGEWEKKMLFETTNRVPLIIFNPDQPGYERRTDFAELVDLYPTAAAMAGLPAPPGLDGKALIGERAVIKDAAFSQYPRCQDLYHPIVWMGCYNTPSSGITWMGYSIRTLHWRYSEWRIWDGLQLQGVWDSRGLYARELYNHTGHFADSNNTFDLEHINLKGEESLQGTILDLQKQLKAHFHPDKVV